MEADRREAEAQARRAAAAQAQARREAEEKARLEGEEKARRDEEARLRSAQPPRNPLDGNYAGSFSETTFGHTRMVSVALQLSGTSLSDQFVYQRCGIVPVSLTVAPSGEIGGSVRLPETMACAPTNGTASGRVTSQGHPARTARTRHRRPRHVGQRRPGIDVRRSSGGPTSLRPIAADLRVSRGRLTGQLVHPTCGATSVSVAVDAAGVVSGTTRLQDPVGCSMSEAAASGKVSADALTLDIRSVAARARGSLSRRPE